MPLQSPLLSKIFLRCIHICNHTYDYSIVGQAQFSTKQSLLILSVYKISSIIGQKESAFVYAALFIFFQRPTAGWNPKILLFLRSQEVCLSEYCIFKMKRSRHLKSPRHVIFAKCQTHEKGRDDKMTVDNVRLNLIHNLAHLPDCPKHPFHRVVHLMDNDSGIPVLLHKNTVKRHRHMHLLSHQHKISHHAKRPRRTSRSLYQMK